MNNGEYWTKRMKMLEDALLSRPCDRAKEIAKAFDRAIASVNRDLKLWYSRLAENNGVTLSEARRLLSADELKEFHWTLEEYIKAASESGADSAWMRELENASAKVHIRRLDAMKLQIRQQAELLAAKQNTALTETLAEIYEDGYYHTAFEIQRGIGTGWEIGVLDRSAVEKVLSKPWAADGNVFSTRVLKNTKSLINNTYKQLTQMIMRGEAPDRAIKAIAETFGVSKRWAGRLIMTESAAMAAVSRKDCFDNLDVERYQIIGLLDHHTCETCGVVDGQIYDMTDYAIGITAPPFHPNCRCTTAPYFDDMEGVGERFARDVDGKTYDVPAGMTYEEWKKEQDRLHGKDFIDTERKKAYNEKADRDQFKRYSKVLTESAPDTFEEFQKLKYEGGEKWEKAKHRYRVVNQYKVDSGSVSEAEIFDLDDRLITEKRDKFTSDFKRSGNIAGAYIDGDSEHFYIAHSRIDTTQNKGYKGYKGDLELVTLRENRRFKYVDVPDGKGGIRSDTFIDTEAKLFELFADMYDKSPYSSITMISERGMCESCQGVMSQFKKAYPDVEVNVISNKRITGDVWKYRRLKRKK